jgi:peroxiredoxin Q/BCP
MQSSTVEIAQVGQPAPKFTLQTFPSGEVKLADFAGKKNVILAFYPKDNTPGCTLEMCGFSADLSKFESVDTEVLGISCDSVNSHEKFAGKFKLKQKLLSDPGGNTARAYGVIAEGKSSASRVLFIIDKGGIVRFIHKGMPNNKKLLEVVSSL